MLSPTDKTVEATDARRRGVLPPFAEAWLLSGFLEEDALAGVLVTYEYMSASLRETITSSFGKAEQLSAFTPGRPALRQVVESDILAMLQPIGATQPAGLENLQGFEWVGIEGLLTGHFLTGPRRDPPAPEEGVRALAAYCLYAGGPTLNPQIIAAAREVYALSPDQFGIGQPAVRLTDRGLVVEYPFEPVVSPIRVLDIGGRLIAIAGLERLVALQLQGRKEALAAISYGYGIDVLSHLPTVPPSILAGPRPPLISDFVDSELAVVVPVRPPNNIVRFRAEVLRFS